MLMREAHYPGLAPIEAYGNGGFRFAGMSHRGSILISPAGIFGWPVDAAAGLAVTDFARLLEADDAPELVLLGTGAAAAPLPGGLRAAFSERRIGLDVMATGAAVRTYNVLLAERRSVGAALIAVR